MSSQQGPKAAPGQHSAHILLGIILREPQSTSANFLGDVDIQGTTYVGIGSPARVSFVTSNVIKSRLMKGEWYAT